MELDVDALVTAMHKVIDVLNDLEYRSTLVEGLDPHDSVKRQGYHASLRWVWAKFHRMAPSTEKSGRRSRGRRCRVCLPDDLIDIAQTVQHCARVVSVRWRRSGSIGWLGLAS